MFDYPFVKYYFECSIFKVVFLLGLFHNQEHQRCVVSIIVRRRENAWRNHGLAAFRHYQVRFEVIAHTRNDVIDRNDLYVEHFGDAVVDVRNG